MKNKERILIQGAMEVEVKYLIDLLEEKSKHSISNFIFYTGTLKGTSVVISQTKIGTINATIATMIAFQNFNVKAVINQGLAGAHLENINVGDLVIGEKCVNINCIRTPQKSKDEGIFPLEWKTSKAMKCIIDSDETLLDIAKMNCFWIKKYIGTLGSGDVFNKEYDRIVWTNNTFGSLCEDMESIAVYTTCYNLKIPCIGIRIISNNELTGQKYDEIHTITCQKFILNMLNDCKKHFLSNLTTSNTQIK